jgi:hypothetical protein
MVYSSPGSCRPMLRWQRWKLPRSYLGNLRLHGVGARTLEREDQCANELDAIPCPFQVTTTLLPRYTPNLSIEDCATSESFLLW